MFPFYLVFFLCIPCYLTSEFNTGAIFKNSNSLLNKLRSDLNITCSTHEYCQDYLENSKCEIGFCRCPESWVLSSDRTKCLKISARHGSPCQENIQCSEILSRGGICHEYKCKCKTGYHYLNGICWKSKGLKQSCQSTEECFAAYDYRGIECINNTCSCKTGFYERLDTACRKSRNSGESCGLDPDCGDGTSCEKMKCGKPKNISVVFDDTGSETPLNNNTKNLNCGKGTFELNGNCVLELGMTCSSDDDCSHIPKAFCLDGICSCGYVTSISNENNTKCMQVARGKVGNVSKTTCKEDPQCTIFGENSICLNKRCACQNGSYWEVNHQYCWKVRSLGENCSVNEDCHPSENFSECKISNNTKKVCSCKQGYYQKNEKCIKEATNVGDYCDSNERCLFPNSFCSKNSSTCLCKEHYFPQNQKCIPGVGSTCSKNEECEHLMNTECVKNSTSEKRCFCLRGHVMKEDGQYCLPELKFDEKCKESFQCQSLLGKLSTCLNNTCQCKPGSHHYYGKCFLKKSIGEPCSSKPECFKGNDTNSVLCLNGYCSCHYDYRLDSDQLCVKTNSGSSLRVHLYLYLLLTAWFYFMRQ